MHQPRLTWTRAALASALSFGALVLAFLYIPHWILTALDSPSRDVRVWMATAWIAFALTLSCVVGWRATGARASAP